MSVDLCIVNYNTADLYDRLIRTLQKDLENQDVEIKIYPQNNDSEDESKVVMGHWYASEHVTEKPVFAENVGYSAACNSLAARGDGEIIGLLNADVWLTSHDVQKIYDSFKENPDVHILGPKQRNEHGIIKHAGIIGTNTQPRHRGWNFPDPEDIKFRDRIQCVSVSGSAYFIRRSVWEALTQCHVYGEVITRNAEGAFLPTPHYY